MFARWIKLKIFPYSLSLSFSFCVSFCVSLSLVFFRNFSTIFAWDLTAVIQFGKVWVCSLPLSSFLPISFFFPLKYEYILVSLFLSVLLPRHENRKKIQLKRKKIWARSNWLHAKNASFFVLSRVHILIVLHNFARAFIYLFSLFPDLSSDITRRSCPSLIQTRKQIITFGEKWRGLRVPPA